MNAGRFGPTGQQCFFAYHPPQAGRDGASAVLLCNPWGQEAIRAHRLLRNLAERLAREGHAVLRFDYVGTGDSDGDDAQADWEAWLRNVIAADGELAARSGLATRAWFGLRLGGTLAAIASARSARAPDRLVLWDPIDDGPAYLRELSAAHARERKVLHGVPRPDRAYPDEPDQALGFALPPPFRAALKAVAPGAFAQARTAAAILLTERGAAAVEGPGTALARAGSAVTTVELPSRTDWCADEAMNTSIVPREGLEAAMRALAGTP